MKQILTNLKVFLFVTLLVTCSNANNKQLGTQHVFSVDPQTGCNSCKTKITIDGKNDEWKNCQKSVINEKTFFGACRDNDYLYLCLTTSDPEFSMIIMNFGLRLWIDPQAGHKKSLGIQFPEVQMQPPPPRDAKPPVGDTLKKVLDQRTKSIIIEFPKDKEIKIMTREEAKAKGIEGQIGIEEGVLCYEVRYPLQKSPEFPLGLDILNNHEITICIETPDIDFDKIMKKYGEAHRPPDANKVQNVSGPKVKPKPPQMKKINQWVEVAL